MSMNSIENLKNREYNKAIVFGGADITGVNKEFLEDKYIIAVDRGLGYIIDNGIKFDTIIGDFDSLDTIYSHLLIENKEKVISFNKDKDMTDLELAIIYLIQNGIDNIDIYGGIGSRLDHTLSNIYMLKKYRQSKITLINENNYIFYLEKDKKIEKSDDYKYISILSTDEKCEFSVSGVKWPLQNHKLEYGSSLTISNEIIDIANIKIHKGNLFVILSKD